MNIINSGIDGGVKTLANGYLRLKGSELLKRYDKNLHRASQNGAFSYATVHRYIKHPDDVQAMNVRVLYGFLVEGLGLTPEELSQMKFGDVFDVIPDEEQATK